MLDVIVNILAAIVGLITNLGISFLNWSLNFFTESDFLIQFDLNGSTSLYTIFDTGSSNILMSLINNVLFPLSLGLIAILTAWSLFKAMMSDKETESPIKICVKAGVSIFLARYIYNILSLLATICLTAEKWIVNFFGSESVVDSSTIDSFYSLLEGYQGELFADIDSSIASLGMTIVICVCVFMIAWRFVKLSVQYISRYVRAWMVMIFGPLASSTYVSESTSDIFKSYINMYVSSLISVCISYMMVLLGRVMCAATLNASSIKRMLIYFCFTFGFCQFAENIDDYLNKLGLKTAGKTTPAMLNSIGQQISRQFSQRATGAVFGAPKAVAGAAVGVTKSAGGFVADKVSQKAENINTDKAAAKGDQRVNTSDTTKMAQANKDAQNKSQATVTGKDSFGQTQMKMAKDGDKYKVTGMSQNYGDIGAAAEAAKATQADVTGANGKKMSISQKDDGTYGIKDADHNLDINPQESYKTIGDAISAASDAGGGSLSGNASFRNSSGEAYGTVLGKDGGVDCSRNYGSFENVDDAVNCMQNAGSVSFDVENRAGYSMSNLSGHDVGFAVSGSNVGVSFQNKGKEVQGTMYSDGSVSVTGRNGKSTNYSSVDSYVKQNKSSTVTYHNVGKATNNDQKNRKEQKKNFFH